MSISDLIHEALAIAALHADVIDSTDMGTHAVEAAIRNWEVLPLRGKAPAIPSPHPKGSRERQTCKGECGKPGHGVFDATTDIVTALTRWGGRYAGWNIGCRVPDSMFVLDNDPRHGGLDSLAKLEKRYGKLPETLMTVSGRGDGRAHYFYRLPHGKLCSRRLGPGIDIKTSAGYVVLPPSIHTDYAEVCVKPRICGDGQRSWGVLLDFSA